MTLIEKIYEVMDGFATKIEIDEEVAELVADGYDFDTALKILIANIDHWAKWCNADAAAVVWDRMDEYEIEIEREYCSH